MEAPALAHAYVTLDRLVFFQLQRSSGLQDYYALARQHLKEQEGLVDFRRLCDARAEGEELLWLLVGCEGLPGLARSEEVFGWSAAQLKKALGAIECAARVMEKTRHYPFGILVQLAAPLDAQTPEHLRSYTELVRAAQRDFSHGSQWFLNIAKARLVLHVTHRTRGPHDPEVSGLIAAMTSTSYNADAQRRWRHEHDALIQDTWLDPYTTQTQGEREESRRLLEETTAQSPELAQTIARLTSAFVRLAKSRLREPRNRRSSKNLR